LIDDKNQTKGNIMKHTLRRIALVILATLLVAISFEAVAAPRHTGVQGRIFHYISYGTPYEIEPGVWIGIPSVQLPVAASFRVLSARNGREVARGGSDANGDYAVSLPPGNYILVPEEYEMPFGCSVSAASILFTVRPHRQTTVNIFYFQDGPCGFFALTPNGAVAATGQ
jgi:hypothetical protein